MRTQIFRILCGVTLATVLGCSDSPVAPSSVVPTRTIDSAATAPSTGQRMMVSPLRFGNRTPGVVFVTSQGLYYDTFVVQDPLPMEGRFQLITDGRTEFGPGDPGYLGGRWWEDVNGNGIQDPDDHYFLCPLLPPGRPSP